MKMYNHVKETRMWQYILMLVLLMAQGAVSTVMAADDATTIITAAKSGRPSASKEAYATEPVNGVTYYVVPDTARYANLYWPTSNDELNAYNARVVGNSAENSHIYIYKRTSGNPSGTKDKDWFMGVNTTTGVSYGDVSLPFTIDVNIVGWSVYYATGWESSSTKDSNGRILIEVPESLTVDNSDGSKTTLPVISTRMYIYKRAYYGIGQNANSTPFDLKLPANLCKVDGLSWSSNIHEVTFTKGTDGKTNLYEIKAQAFYESKNLTIGGLKNYEFDSGHLFHVGGLAIYGTAIRRIKISSPLTTIGAGAFSSDNLEYVDLSDIPSSSLTSLQQKSIIMLRNKDMIDEYKTKNTGLISSIAGMFSSMPDHVLVYLPTGIEFTDDQLNAFKVYGSPNFIYKDKTKGLYCRHFKVFDGTKTETYTEFDKNTYQTVTKTRTVSDSYDYYVPTAFRTDSVTYTRSFLDGYNTTYLPYSVARPTEVTAVYTFSGTRTKQDWNTKYAYEFKAMTTLPDSLQPNTPYLLYSKTGYSMKDRTPDELKKYKGPKNTEGSMSLLTVPTTPDFNSYTVTSAKNVQFIGTTEVIPNDSAVLYNGYNLAYNDNNEPEWRMVKTTNTSGHFGRFRGFICDNDESSTSPAKEAVVSIIFHNANGSTTSIEGLSVGDLTSGDKRIYSIDGKYVGMDVNALPAGIYIKDGKKFLKK